MDSMKIAFEYDNNKSISNKEKHGIDFQEIQMLWSDENKTVLPAKSSNIEIRYMVVGMLNKKMYSVVITFRGSTIRIISARRSRANEIELYKKEPE